MPILDWLTRDEDVQATKKVPYRLLEEVPELSYGDKDTGNMLIQGDISWQSRMIRARTFARS